MTELASRASALVALVDSGVYGEELQSAYGTPEEGWEDHQRQLLTHALQTQDGILVGATLWLAPLRAPASGLLPLLYQLLEADWHDAHETIADELGRDLATPENITALFECALRPLPEKFYDAPIFSLGTRCVWGLGNIGTAHAVIRLGELLEHGNGVVRRQTRGQLERLAKDIDAPVAKLAATTLSAHLDALGHSDDGIRSLVRRVDILADHVFWDGPPQARDLKELEQTLETSLPEPYRQFLVMTGGGGGPNLEWLNLEGCLAKTLEWRSQGLIDDQAVAVFEFHGVRWFVAGDGQARCHGKGASWAAADSFVELLSQYVSLLTEPLEFQLKVARSRDPSPRWRRVLRSLDVQELALVDEQRKHDGTVLVLKATHAGQFAASALVAIADFIRDLRDANAQVALDCPWSGFVPTRPVEP